MVTTKDVQYIANLARIHLEGKELEDLTSNLEKILHYINHLENLDVNQIQPTSHILDLINVYREDRIQPSLSQDESLSIAVAKHTGSFKVPPIIE